MTRQTTIIFFLTIHMLSAQDIHFSQFDGFPDWLNFPKNLYF